MPITQRLQKQQHQQQKQLQELTRNGSKTKCLVLWLVLAGCWTFWGIGQLFLQFPPPPTVVLDVADEMMMNTDSPLQGPLSSLSTSSTTNSRKGSISIGTTKTTTSTNNIDDTKKPTPFKSVEHRNQVQDAITAQRMRLVEQYKREVFNSNHYQPHGKTPLQPSFHTDRARFINGTSITTTSHWHSKGGSSSSTAGGMFLAKSNTTTNVTNTTTPPKSGAPYRRTVAPYQRKYPRVIYFVHIHKSAGTLFCRLVYRNRISCNQKQNCNVQRDQYCCGDEDTMEAQIFFAQTTYYDMVAIEREMYEHMAPQYYDYVVCLRQSKERYYSHWGHLRRYMPIGPGIQRGGFGVSSWIYGNNTSPNRKHKEKLIPAGYDPLGTFVEWYQGQPDNWNTRIVCGKRCRWQAKFQITPELFHYTLQRADQFAHFLFVESFEASYDQMAKFYQWSNFSDLYTTFLETEKSNRRQDKFQAEEELTKEPWDSMMSALDDALYEFAQRKFHLIQEQQQNNFTFFHPMQHNSSSTSSSSSSTADHLWDPFQNQVEVDEYFAKGPQRGCTNACCGRCTSY